MIVALVVSTVAGALPVQAASPTTPTAQASAFAYMTAVKSCIANGLTPVGGVGTLYLTGFGNQSSGYWHDKITVENVKAGNWWQDNYTVEPSFLLGSAGTDSKAKCDEVLRAGLDLWGFTGTDYLGLLCSFVSYRDDGSSCATGADDLFGDISHFADKFEQAVETKINGGSKLTATAPELYVLNRAVFLSSDGCKAVPSANPAKNFAYTDIQLVDPTTGAITKTTYEGLARDTTRTVYLDSNSSAVSQNCGQIADAINGNAVKYSTAVQHVTGGDAKSSDFCYRNPTDPSCATNSAPSCGNTISGVGWIACPVLTALGGLDDALWTFVSALLTTSPLAQTQTNPDGSTSTTLVYQVWQTFRSLADVALVIVFLVIIFSQLSSIGINNYGVKKLLPRLVIVAIAINVSFFVMQAAVDVANIVGSGLYDLMNGIIKDPTPPSWSGLLTVILGLGAGGGVLAGAIAIAPEAALMLLIPGALAAVLGFLAAVLTLMFRQAIIPVLAVVAPLAFVAYLLPNTKPWFDKWRRLFTSMLLLFPLAAVLFAGVKLSAEMINSGGQWWQTLTALIILGAPLFMLPFLARQSGPLLGKVAGTLNGLASKVQKPVGSWANGRREASLARSDATTPGRFNMFKRGRQGLIRSQRRRDLKTAGYKADADTAFNNDLAANADTIAQGLGAAGQAHVRAVATRAQAEEVKLAMDSMKLEAGFNPSDRTALARTLAQAITQNDHTRATAASNYLVAARGVDELHSTLGAAQAAGRMSADMSTAMQRVMTSAENGGVIKERRPDLTAWGAQGGSIAGISAKPGTWSISAEDAAGLSIGAMKDALATGGMPADIASRVLDTPQLRARLDTTKEAVMQQIAGRAARSDGRSGLILPGDSDFKIR